MGLSHMTYCDIVVNKGIKKKIDKSTACEIP